VARPAAGSVGGHRRRCRMTRSQPQAQRDGQRGGGRRDRAQRHRAVARHQTESQHRPGDGDGTEKHRVQQDHEGEQGPRCCQRLQARAPQRPYRQRGAAHPGRGQKPSGSGSGQRDLGALPRTDPGRRSPADQRQQNHVAGKGQRLEADAGRCPGRAGIKPPPQGGGERMQRSAAQQDDAHRHHQQRRGDRTTADQPSKVWCGERQLGDGLIGGEHVFQFRWRPSATSGQFYATRPRPDVRFIAHAVELLGTWPPPSKPSSTPAGATCA
jgi:hypothetical protein